MRLKGQLMPFPIDRNLPIVYKQTCDIIQINSYSLIERSLRNDL